MFFPLGVIPHILVPQLGGDEQLLPVDAALLMASPTASSLW